MENNTQHAPTEGKNAGLADGAVQHTPGPWKVTGPSRHGFYCKVRGTRLGQKFTVANCPFLPDSRADKVEAEANARLIAAAPDLLTALRRMVGAQTNAMQLHYEEPPELAAKCNCRSCAKKRALAAIAKATSDEPANEGVEP